jgi:monofunctional biosynthetic peptidoglycan transglycosylase
MKKIFLIILILVASCFIIDVGRYLVYPNVVSLKNKHPGKTAFMIYREGTWKKKGIKKTINSIWIPLTQISPYVTKAVIIAEDDNFWSHEGFDYNAIMKALETDIKRGKFKTGGSTISQQLAKNLFLTPERTLLRKVKEGILTYRLEHNLSKQRIMELYLNVAEWGDGVFGIEAAAQIHYRKHASELNAREAATLAVILPNPRRYKSDGTSKYVEGQAERIYQIMVRRGIVIPEYDEVINEAEVKDTVGEDSSQKKTINTFFGHDR